MNDLIQTELTKIIVKLFWQNYNIEIFSINSKIIINFIKYNYVSIKKINSNSIFYYYDDKIISLLNNDEIIIHNNEISKSIAKTIMRETLYKYVDNLK
jgi:hypothetical protein